MIDNLVPYVFANNAYYAAVKDREITMNSILLGFDEDKWEKIFKNETMGFANIKSLSKWIRALEGGNT